MAFIKNIQVSAKRWDSLKPELLVLGIFEDKNLSELHEDVDEKSHGSLSKLISSGDFTGKLNKTSLIYSDGPAKRILIVGLGKKEEFTLERLRQVAGTAVKTAQANKWKQMVTEIPGKWVLLKENKKNKSKGLPARQAGLYQISQAFAEGTILGSYKFMDYKTDNDDHVILDSLTVVDGADKEGVRRGEIIGEAVCFVRDLASHPSNVVTPTRLANEAKKIAQTYGMKCTIWDRDEFTKKGMGAFASVAKGSDEPPKFILLEYRRGRDQKAPIAFVGKGITFDTGGISIKPSESMDEMKYDMCGGAAVLGIMKALGQLKPKVNVIGAVLATENMPGGHAVKPGDIVKAYNGKTIEILNTDAEGRLILSDALAYVTKNYRPRYIMDFATLTGAVIIALGHLASGVMGTDRKLIDAIIKAGEVTGERVWEFPLWDDYSEDVKSKVADVKNIGAHRQAGTIAGGAFLKEFVGETPWAHIDIAGTAWWDKDRPYIPSGPSGIGVRLSLELLNLLK